MTQLLVPKSPYVLKKLGGWGCGSEQAHLTISSKMWKIKMYQNLKTVANVAVNEVRGPTELSSKTSPVRLCQFCNLRISDLILICGMLKKCGLFICVWFISISQCTIFSCVYCVLSLKISTKNMQKKQNRSLHLQSVTE